MIYRFSIAVLLAAALGGMIFGARLVKAQSNRPPAPEPLAEPAKPQFEDQVAATGIIEALDENVAIATSKPGLVMQVHVKVGDDVKEGAPLFQLDDREARVNVETLRAQADVQRAAVEAEEVLLRDARDQWARTERLMKERVASEDEGNRKKFAAENSEARVAKSRADLAAAEAQVKAAEVQLAVLTVRAPRDGRILQLNLRAGEYANANPGTPLIVLGKIETLQVRADVDEQNAPYIKPGAPAAKARLKGTNSAWFPLKFRRIDPFVVPKKSLTGESTERVDTRVLQVIFEIVPPAGGETRPPLYVGQQVDVSIEGQDAR